MKTVFDHEMTAHVWAQQSQPSGRSSDRRMYFEGSNLYSYGPHFVLGHITPDGTALLNSNGYSSSTGKHKFLAARAVSHRTVFYVPELTKLVNSGFLSDPKKHAKSLRTFLEGNGKATSSEASTYLWIIAGNKTPAKTALAIATANDKRSEKEAEKKAKATRAENLAYGAKAAMLAHDEKALVSGLANVLAGNDGQVAAQATKLHHAHRALKATKRDRQAADCYRVLQLVRAEIKLREKQAARKQDNHRTAQNLKQFRDGLAMLRAAFTNNACITSSNLHSIESSAEALAANSNIPASVRPRLAAIAEFASEAYEAVSRQEAAEREARDAAALAAWRAGEVGARAPYTSRYSTEGALLRAINVTRDASGNITGGELQTSQGADVPLTHAVRAFRFLKLCKERNAAPLAPGDAFIDTIAWQRIGHSIRVGHFTIDTVWASGNFRAGCHTVKWPETEALARQLGIFADAGSDEALTASTEAA
jgi:hypothetical protein